MARSFHKHDFFVYYLYRGGGGGVQVFSFKRIQSSNVVFKYVCSCLWIYSTTLPILMGEILIAL